MIFYTSTVIIIIAITRALAYWGTGILKNGEIKVFENIFHLTYVENTGAAFGMFENSTVLLSVTGILLFLIVTYFVAWKKISGKYTIFLFALLSGGGISNVCDRMSFGYVVDYFNFCLIDYPVFNFADICIVVSCILIAIKIIREDSNKGKE